MIGRLVTHWEDIVGADMARKAQPVKIRYFRGSKDGETSGQKKKASASLDIACSSADATVLHYRKDLILERINRIFGDSWITSIRFVPVADNHDADKRGATKTKKRLKNLTLQDKKHLSDVLDRIDDPGLQERLQNLGEAILRDQPSDR